MPLKWSYGVTTTEQRKDDLLPRTLESLCRAGFDSPRLFVDSCRDQLGYADRFGLPVTVRAVAPGQRYGVRTAGNWHLALLELWIREPWADRYAIFQDDLVTGLGLRDYLDRSPYPPASYINLYTFPPPRQVEPEDKGHFRGWYLARRREPKFKGGVAVDGGPTGQGAVALVFDRPATEKILTSLYFLQRHMCPVRGFHSIDGGITEALDEAGVKEYVHWPSLVQHTGLETSRDEARNKAPFPTAPTFPGEDFDLTTLLTVDS